MVSEVRANPTAAQTDLELVAAPGTGRVIVVEQVHFNVAGAVTVSLSAGALVATKEKTTIDRGTSTGGTFTLTVGSQTTAAIVFGANAAAVKAALELLTTVTTVAVTGTGTAGDPWIAEFDDPIRSLDVSGDGTNLTGGDSTLTVTETVDGVATLRWKQTFGAADGIPSAGPRYLFTCGENTSLNLTTSAAVECFVSVDYQIRDVGAIT